MLVPRTSDALEVAGCIAPGGQVYVCECLQLECGDMQSPGSWPVSTHTTMGGPGQSLCRGHIQRHFQLILQNASIVYELNTNSYFLWQCKTILSLLISGCGPHLVCQCALRPGLRPLVPVFSPGLSSRPASAAHQSLNTPGWQESSYQSGKYRLYKNNNQSVIINPMKGQVPSILHFNL